MYPNAYFPELNCAYCNLHRAMSPEEGGEKLYVVNVSQIKRDPDLFVSLRIADQEMSLATT